jgi:two-component system, OmpR family, response regulator
VWRSDVEVQLSPREFALLETFMRRPGLAISKPQLLESVWGSPADRSLNVVEVYVRYLREKIDRPFGAQSIETVRGMGYRLRENAAPQLGKP